MQKFNPLSSSKIDFTKNAIELLSLSDSECEKVKAAADAKRLPNTIKAIPFSENHHPDNKLSTSPKIHIKRTD